MTNCNLDKSNTEDTPTGTNSKKYNLLVLAEVSRLCVSENDTMQYACEVFEAACRFSGHAALIVIDENLRFYGIMTQKDINMFLEKNPGANLRAIKVEQVYNKAPRFIITTDELKKHEQNNTDPFNGLPPSVSFMPLLDDIGRIANVVYNQRFQKSHDKLAIGVDINDACQLRCSSCPRGLRKMKNTSCIMSVDTFEEIVKKAKTLGVDSFDLFNWTEPFLNEDLYRYMEILRDYSIPRRGVSSNFSINNIINFDRFLDSGFSEIIVSVSGFTQETYERYHRGGELELVKRNIEYAAKYKEKKGINGDIRIRYLNFGYNSSEVQQFKDYARELNLLFEILKGNGFDGTVPSKAPEVVREEPEKTAAYLREYHSVSFKEKKWKTCAYYSILILDCNADVYLCCKLPNYACFKVGNFLTDSYEDIFINKFLHPYCSICTQCPEKTTSFPESVRKEIIKRMEQ